MITTKHPPPLIALIFLVISWFAHVLLTTPKIIVAPFNHLGLILIATGIGIMIWAWVLFKIYGTQIHPTGKTTSIVRTGPYRMTRNPIYLSMSMILAGVAIIIGTLPMFLAPLAFITVINAVFIPYEENKLETIFGRQYEDYKNQVRRWV